MNKYSSALIAVRHQAGLPNNSGDLFYTFEYTWHEWEPNILRNCLAISMNYFIFRTAFWNFNNMLIFLTIAASLQLIVSLHCVL